MRPASTALMGALLMSCSGGPPGEGSPPASSAPLTAGAASTPSAPTTVPVASSAMTPEKSTFVDLVLSLPPRFVLDRDTREEMASPIPGAAPAVEHFRSYTDAGAPVLFFFTWDGFPARDRGPMKAVESWKLPVGSVIADVSRTSHFFGGEKEVLVAHFEGPPPARRRYMIYTTQIDRGAFEEMLKGIRFSPAK